MNGADTIFLPTSTTLAALIAASAQNRAAIRDRYGFWAEEVHRPVDGHLHFDASTPVKTYEIMLRGRRAAYLFVHNRHNALLLSNQDAPLTNAILPGLIAAIAQAFHEGRDLDTATADGIDAWNAECQIHCDARHQALFGA